MSGTDDRTAGLSGHLPAFITIFIWGTTYISTKILLQDFSPIQILLARFVIGFVILCLINHHRLKTNGFKTEIYFAAAGLTGICLYYLLENIALVYTTASNAGVIVAAAPFFTAILSQIFFRDKKYINSFFVLGFLLAIAGTCILSFKGNAVTVNPKGDFLAFCAAFAWAVYSVICRKISEFNFPTIAATRHTFAYGLVFMSVAAFVLETPFSFNNMLKPLNFFNLIFLGAGASALCFVTWNFSVKRLGAVKTSAYIYLTPVITVTTSLIVLKEKLNFPAVCGIILTLSGLFISNINAKKLSKYFNGCQ